MRKLISAMLLLLMFAAAAMARPAPPPRGPQGGNDPSDGARPSRPAPRPNPGAQRPARPPAPRPGLNRPARPAPHRPAPPRPSRPAPRPPAVRPGHRPPPPPPRFYYRHHHHHWHSDWFIGGLGLGLIIGVLSNRDYNAPYDYASRAEEVRKAARETAEQQSRHFVEIISRIGSQDALYELNEYWQAQGQSTALETSDPIRSLRVTGFQDDLVIVYWLDRASKEETVTVSAPLYNVSETARARYNEPPGGGIDTQISADSGLPSSSNVPHEETQAFARLGFTLDEDARTSDGHLIVQSVTPSTVAASTGMEKGATLYAIDGNTTAQVSVEQLCAFIERRAAAGASVRVAFSNGGASKSVVMQL